MFASTGLRVILTAYYNQKEQVILMMSKANLLHNYAMQ